MHIKNSDIAMRLRTAREIAELTPQAVASALDIPVEEYVKYESGELEVPANIVVNVSPILKVSATDLLTGDSAKLHTYAVVKKGKGIKVDRVSAYRYEDLAFSFANRRFEPFLVTVEPNDDKPLKTSTHKGHEFHYCLEGSFIFSIDGQEVEINQGDSIYFDSVHPHGMKVVGQVPAKILVVVI